MNKEFKSVFKSNRTLLLNQYERNKLEQDIKTIKNMDYLNVILNDLNFVNRLISINYQNLGTELFHYKTTNPFNTEKINSYKNFIKEQVNNCNEKLKINHYKFKPIKQNQINFNINTSLLTSLINEILEDGIHPFDVLENDMYTLILYIKYYKITNDIDSIKDIKTMLSKKASFHTSVGYLQKHFDYYVNKI